MTWEPPQPLRLGKNGSTGIGQSKRTAFKRIKQVSKKQGVRNEGLRSKRETLLNLQHEVYGFEFCSAQAKKWPHECFGSLVLDHVEGRNNEDADGYGNLQIICESANMKKGSVRGLDFRDKRYRDKLAEL